MIKYENEFVDYATAKGLSELGYSQLADHWYDEENELITRGPAKVQAPRVSEVRKWFRDKFGCDVQVDFKAIGNKKVRYVYKIVYVQKDTNLKMVFRWAIPKYYSTYEAAAAAGVRALVDVKLGKEEMNHENLRAKLV